MPGAVADSEVRAAGSRRESEVGARGLIAAFIAVLLLPAVLGSSLTIFNDGDVSWHIATGLWILDHRAIPAVDPFSFTAAGKPWVPIEWLSEVIYASAYRLAGYGGVAAVVTAALMALHALVYFHTRRFVPPLLPIVAMDIVLVPMLLARPHVLTWPLLALWTLLMLRARERDRAPSLAAALLLTLWANLHGSFVIAFVIAGAFGLEALVDSRDRLKALRQWLVFGLACLAASLVNANGPAGLAHPFYLANQSILPLVDEWKPSNPAVTPFFFGMLALVAALILWKRPRLPWVRWLFLAGLLAMALYQVRHQAMFAIVAALVLSQGFARGAVHPAAVERKLPAFLAGGALMLLAARALMPLAPPENGANPWKLIAAVPAHLRGLPVLNSYSMGGPLILSGIRPFIDGRADMYGDAFVHDYARISRGDRAAFEAAVERWDIRWAIVSSESAGLDGLLSNSANWRRIAQDPVGAIYVREENAAAR